MNKTAMNTTMMNRMAKFSALTGMILLFSITGWSQAASANSEPPVPIEEWKSAVIAGDSAALSGMYSTSPAMQASTAKGPIDAATESSFWTGLKARALKLDIVQRSSPQAGAQIVTFQADVQQANDVVYVTESQLWQLQSGQWKLAASKRTEAAHLKQPLDQKKNIYPPDADAHAEIKEAEEHAAKEHKRVLLVFGANWCYDCHVLDLAFHRPDFASAVDGYEIVHVDIGDDGKKNSDLAKQFNVPLEKGVPALAVLESNGKLVVSQKNGEFENARAMTPKVLMEFLNKWKPEAR
jgi:uncharacterized protein YchJ